MRERHDRHAHAGHARDLRGEHAAGVDDDLGLDRRPTRSARRAPRRRPCSSTSIAGHARVREDRAPPARARRRRARRSAATGRGSRRSAGRTPQRTPSVAISGNSSCASLGARSARSGRPNVLRPGDLAQHLLLALLRAGEADAAALHPAAARSVPVELDRVHHHPRQRAGSSAAGRRGPAEWKVEPLVSSLRSSSTTSRSPSCGQVVGDRGAADAAADDDDAGAVGKLTRPDHRSSLRSGEPLAEVRSADGAAEPREVRARRSHRSRSRGPRPMSASTPHAASRASESTRISFSVAALAARRLAPW